MACYLWFDLDTAEATKLALSFPPPFPHGRVVLAGCSAFECVIGVLRCWKRAAGRPFSAGADVCLMKASRSLEETAERPLSADSVLPAVPAVFALGRTLKSRANLSADLRRRAVLGVEGS